MKLLFDTHLDLAWNALSWGRDVTRSLEEINAREQGMTDDGARGRATTSLPQMRRGGVAVCLATVMARVKPEVRPPEGHSRASLDYASPSMAYAAGQGQLAYYRLLEEQEEVKILRTAADLQRHWQRWAAASADGRADGIADGTASGLPVGIILAMEGADPIVSPGQAESWFGDGLRSVSLAHYGPSRYAMGTGQAGPLTPEGVRLLAEFERLGMILDATHLSEPGFSQALDRFGGPLMASHNNCRALVPGDRQFADDQVRRLVDRQAVIGVALDAWMLYPGWQRGQTSRQVVGLEAVAGHVDHVCQLAGDCRHVGIGSDLDGGFGTEQTPRDLDTIADLQKLAGTLSARGYHDEDIDAIFHGNWLRFFRRNLPQ
jgi:membrane dipeptidase